MNGVLWIDGSTVNGPTELKYFLLSRQQLILGQLSTLKVNFEYLPLVINAPNPTLDRVPPCLGVLNDGITSPWALPKLISQSKIFVSYLISLIMSNLRRETDVLRCSLQVACDSISRNTAFCQMIQSSKTSCEKERIFVCCGCRDSKW